MRCRWGEIQTKRFKSNNFLPRVLAPFLRSVTGMQLAQLLWIPPLHSDWFPHWWYHRGCIAFNVQCHKISLSDCLISLQDLQQLQLLYIHKLLWNAMVKNYLLILFNWSTTYILSQYPKKSNILRAQFYNHLHMYLTLLLQNIVIFYGGNFKHTYMLAGLGSTQERQI